MTIAEALVELKHLQSQINKTQSEFNENCVKINGQETERKPDKLFNRVLTLIEQRTVLENALQVSNSTVKIENGITLLAAMNRRKYLKALNASCNQMYDSMISQKRQRGYVNTTEIRSYAIEPEKLKDQIDSSGKELRQLEAMIQKCNYTASLITV